MTFQPSTNFTKLRNRLARALRILGIITLILAAATRAPAAAAPLAEIDGLLNSPGLSLAQAQEALARCQALLASPEAPRAALLTRLARISFILGDLAPQGERPAYYEKGLAYAEQLVKEKPGAVAGHYWQALNLCGLADVGGKLKGRKLLPRILEELQKSLAIDEAYDQAGAHRVLGRIYYEAPRRPFSVGDLDKSLKHLTAAARLAPETSTNHLYLAETLIRLQQPSQARQELERTLTASRHAVQPQGLREDQQEARRLLAELEGK